MYEDDLIGYHGNSIRTYQDWECTEMMEDILRDDEFSNLSDKDKNLLEEYAPRLFNTAKYERESLKVFMRDLCRKVAKFRKGISGFKFAKKKTAIYKNSSDEEIKDALRGHAKAILNLTGNPENGELDYFTEKYHFFRELHLMIECPEDFLSMDVQYKPASKTKIKKYLHNLQLPNKTNTIKEFIEEL